MPQVVWVSFLGFFFFCCYMHAPMWTLFFFYIYIMRIQFHKCQWDQAINCAPGFGSEIEVLNLKGDGILSLNLSEWDFIAHSHASQSLFHHSDLSLVTRKPVFGVFDQVRLKPVCSTKEASKSHEIANIETRDSYSLGSEQQRCWSDCADVQADLHLCCSHMA